MLVFPVGVEVNKSSNEFGLIVLKKNTHFSSYWASVVYCYCCNDTVVDIPIDVNDSQSLQNMCMSVTIHRKNTIESVKRKNAECKSNCNVNHHLFVAKRLFYRIFFFKIWVFLVWTWKELQMFMFSMVPVKWSCKLAIFLIKSIDSALFASAVVIGDLLPVAKKRFLFSVWKAIWTSIRRLDKNALELTLVTSLFVRTASVDLPNKLKK